MGVVKVFKLNKKLVTNQRMTREQVRRLIKNIFK
jgi:hypothetical protein